MIASFKLAGLFAAHSLHEVSEGETFVPLLVYTTSPDECKVVRLAINEDMEACVAYGKEMLEFNEMDDSVALKHQNNHLAGMIGA